MSIDDTIFKEITMAGLESHNEGLKNNQSIPNSLKELASRVSNVCTKHCLNKNKDACSNSDRTLTTHACQAV